MKSNRVGLPSNLKTPRISRILLKKQQSGVYTIHGAQVVLFGKIKGMCFLSLFMQDIFNLHTNNQ
jgi:hypothetical protein